MQQKRPNSSKKNSRDAQFSGRNNELRLIAGDWRGRKLTFANEAGLRPTGNRVREAIFNWLHPFVINANVVDLFAGSGALGFEAVSRGANSAVLIDSNSNACKHLQASKTALKSEQIEIHQQSALSFVDSAPAQSVDLLFIDPPFDRAIQQSLLESNAVVNMLKAGARVVVESPKNQIIVIPSAFTLLRQKAFAEVQVLLLEKN